MKKILIILIVSLSLISVLNGSIMVSESGITPLMKAIQASNYAECVELLKSTGNINQRTTTYHVTALDFAINSNEPLKFAKLLLDNGADPLQSRGFWKKIIEKFGRLHYQPKENAQKIAELSEVMRLSFAVHPNKDYSEILPIAMQYGVPLDIIKKILENNTSPDIRNYRQYGQTALHFAVLENNTAGAEMLLKAGANPNLYDYQDRPILFDVKSDEMLKLFLQYDAQLENRVQNRWFLPQQKRFTDYGFGSAEEFATAILVEISLLEAWSSWATPYAVKEALKSGCKIDEKTVIAMGNNANLESVYELLAENYDGYMPLEAMLENAIGMRNYSIIPFLESKGAKIRNPYTVCKLVFFGNPNTIYWGRKSKEILEILFKYGVDLDVPDLQYNATVLEQSILQNDFESVKFLLEHAKVNPNRKNTKGETPLFLALTRYEVNLEIVKLLLQHGGDVPESNANNVTVLISALFQEVSPEVIDFILDMQKIDVNAATVDGVTALMIASEKYPSSIVKKLLAQGAKVNACDKGEANALHYAVKYFSLSKEMPMSYRPAYRTADGAEEIIRLLLFSDIDAKKIDRFGNHALIQSAGWVTPETLQLLLNKMGKKFINKADAYGRSAIMYACAFNNDLNIAELLLKNGARTEVRMKSSKVWQKGLELDRNRYSQIRLKDRVYISAIFPPIYYAAMSETPELLNLLIKYKVDMNYRKLWESGDDGELDDSALFFARKPEIKQIMLSSGAAAVARKYADNDLSQIRTIDVSSFIGSCERYLLNEIQERYSQLKFANAEEKNRVLKEARTMALMENSLEVIIWLNAQNTDMGFDIYDLCAAALNRNGVDALGWVFPQVSETQLKDFASRGNNLMCYANTPASVEFLSSKGYSAKSGAGEQIPIYSAMGYGNKVVNRIELTPELLRSLAKHGANIKSAPGNRSYLFLLMKHGLGDEQYNLFRTFLELGANPDAIVNGQSLLDMAIERGDCQLFDILISANASPKNIPANIRSKPYIMHRLRELEEPLNE